MKKTPLLLCFLAFPLLFASCHGGDTSSISNSSFLTNNSSSLTEEVEYNVAEVYETTGSRSKLFTRTNDLSLTPYSYQGHSEVYVGDEPLGTFYGHGAALTHSSAYLLSQLDQEKRTALLEDLFGDDGAHLSLVRIPWGTSDYTLPEEDFYTFDDVEGAMDYTLEHFSIEKDERFLIPVLKEIIEINPDVIIFAAPWSAPAWMKTSNNLVGGQLLGYDNQSLENPSPEETAYASYLHRAVEAYAEDGIMVDYVSIVNEPLVQAVNYPYMRMDSAQEYRVASLLGEKLAESSYETKIMGYDHNVGSAIDITFDGYASTLASQDALSGRLGGFAVHCYDGNWPNIYGDFAYNYQSMELYGDYPLFITEVTESSSSVDFAQNLSWSADNVAIGPVGQGYNGAIYWNLVLDPNGQPVKGNSSTCYGLVTLEEDGSHSYSSSYYAMKHLSHFSHIQDGEMPQRVSSDSTNFGTIVTAALKNQDGTTTVALVNTSDRVEEMVDVIIDEKMVTVTIKPQSVTTLLFKNGEGENFESIELASIEIEQIAYGKFHIAFTLEEKEDGVRFYFSSNAPKEEGLLSLTYRDGVYEGELSALPGDYGLLMQKDDREGELSLTIPRLNPSISLLEGDNYFIEAKFGLDTGMSWSSFCDPYGKMLYRSSSATFDENAVQANVNSEGETDEIYITTDEYVDRNSKEEEPYYFFQLIGKDGLVTYTSAAVTFQTSLFDTSSDALTLAIEEDHPYLIYEGVALSDSAKSSLLYLKDINGEEHASAPASVSEENSIRIAFDLTLLEKRGVWYDLFLIDGGGASSFEFTTDDTPSYSEVIEHNHVQYRFENWEGVIKINAISL